MKIFNKISRLPEFERDLKKLLKRFKTLKEDLKIFVEKQLNLYHKLNKDNKGIFPMKGLSIEYPAIYKAKKFTCRSLKGKGVHSGIRVIYSYFHDEDRIELIEIYYKGDKESEDKDRILRYYKKCEEGHPQTTCIDDFFTFLWMSHAYGKLSRSCWRKRVTPNALSCLTPRTPSTRSVKN